MNVKFCFKLGRPATETYEMLRNLYGDDVYLGLGCLSGLKGLKKEGKRSRTIWVPAVPGPQKRMTAVRKSAKSSEEIDAWASELSLS